MPTGIDSRRDRRIDLLRGISLLMIFADHVPHNILARFTLQNFALCDAAEVFVLLAGLSATLAYGNVLDLHGWRAGLRRIGKRCLRIYGFHAGVATCTFLLAAAWATGFGAPSVEAIGLPSHGYSDFVASLSLLALPGWSDVLPLYIVLLASFPLIHAGLKRRPLTTVVASVALWLAANVDHRLNLPNRFDSQGWFFDPFCWQLVFVGGCVLARLLRRNGGVLPRVPWLTVAAWVYLGFGLLDAFPWTRWHLPDLRPFPVSEADKAHLVPLRVLNIAAVAYLAFGSQWASGLAETGWRRVVEACGRHSLEVFALVCVLSLTGRLAFETFGHGLLLQVGVNAIGFASIGGLALRLERRAACKRLLAPAPAAGRGASAERADLVRNGGGKFPHQREQAPHRLKNLGVLAGVRGRTARRPRLGVVALRSGVRRRRKHLRQE